MMNLEIRLFDSGDLSALARIYKASILHLGSQWYSAEQSAAWSSFADDAADFEKWIAQATTFVAVDDRRGCVGFGGMQSLRDVGRISSLFVAPEAMRQGVGSALLARMLLELGNRGIVAAGTEASEFSKPLFEKFGFQNKRVEHTIFKGVSFDRYVMQLRIDPFAGAPAS